MAEKLRVSKEITLTMSLPHSLKLGETAQISGVIFNNSNQNLDLKVSLESPFRRFEFVGGENAGDKWKLTLKVGSLFHFPSSQIESDVF
jgi:hypothetical protein